MRAIHIQSLLVDRPMEEEWEARLSFSFVQHSNDETTPNRIHDWTSRYVWFFSVFVYSRILIMSDHESSGDASHSNELKAGHAPASKQTLADWIAAKWVFLSSTSVRVGGMRVGASRPRQISQGDDKDRTNSNDEASGQNTVASSSSNGQSGRDSQRDGHDSDGEPKSGYKIQRATQNNRRWRLSLYSIFRAVSNHVAGQMVSGTFVSVRIRASSTNRSLLLTLRYKKRFQPKQWNTSMTNQELIPDMNITLMPNMMINVSSINHVNSADRQTGILTRTFALSMCHTLFQKFLIYILSVISHIL